MRHPGIWHDPWPGSARFALSVAGVAWDGVTDARVACVWQRTVDAAVDPVRSYARVVAGHVSTVDKVSVDQTLTPAVPAGAADSTVDSNLPLRSTMPRRRHQRTVPRIDAIARGQKMPMSGRSPSGPSVPLTIRNSGLDQSIETDVPEVASMSWSGKWHATK